MIRFGDGLIALLQRSVKLLLLLLHLRGRLIALLLRLQERLQRLLEPRGQRVDLVARRIELTLKVFYCGIGLIQL